jgi:hypothetical protein
MILSLLIVVMGLAAHSPVQPPDDEASAQRLPNDSDPVQVVFVSARSEFTNLAGDDWRDAFIIRSDKAVLQRPRSPVGTLGVLLRADVPLVLGGQSGETVSGLGDVYVQGLAVPFLTPRFAFALGTGLQLPTATDPALGAGKWQVAPLVAPVWFFPRGRGFFFMSLQGRVSYAGGANRRDVRALAFRPMTMIRVRRLWWMLFDSEAKTDFVGDNRALFRSGVEVGRAFPPAFALGVKPEAAWGPRREIEWALKLTLTTYRR